MSTLPSTGTPALGRQVLADLHGCDPRLIDDVKRVESVLRMAAEVAGAKVIQGLFHRFKPQGVSGSLVLAESHLAIHTWPEHGVVSLDLFTCGGDVDPKAALDLCLREFCARSCHTTTLERGRPAPEEI